MVGRVATRMDEVMTKRGRVDGCSQKTAHSRITHKADEYKERGGGRRITFLKGDRRGKRHHCFYGRIEYSADRDVR